MQGVFLDRDSVDTGDLDMTGLTTVIDDWQFHDTLDAGGTVEKIGKASVVVSNKVQLDEAVFNQAPGIRLVCVAATGTNNVDLDAAARHGVPVCNVRGYATPAVVQHVYALLLGLTCRINEYRQAIERGDWARSRFFCLLDQPVRELSGLKLGIVGYGELGQAVAHVARAFGMDVVVATVKADDNRSGRVPLDQLLPELDVLSLHCPLAPETMNLIDKRRLSLMKPDAVLINTARGGIVDEQALADALRANRLGGAGFDVLTEEPPVHGSPLLAPDIPNLILTPHSAWSSRESRQRLLEEVALNIRSFLDGELRNAV